MHPADCRPASRAGSTNRPGSGWGLPEEVAAVFPARAAGIPTAGAGFGCGGLGGAGLGVGLATGGATGAVGWVAQPPLISATNIKAVRISSLMRKLLN